MYAQNLRAFRAWGLVCGCWRSSGMGGVLGLDWPSVQVILRAAGISFTPKLLRALLLMERAALQEWRR